MAEPVSGATSGLRVLCLCAEWCSVCREYRPGYDALARERPDVEFHWIDIEDEDDWPDALEVEDFPSIAIQHGEAVLFFGAILPQHGHLLRLVDEFAHMDAATAHEYAHATEERRAWQAAAHFQPRSRG